MKIKPTKYDFKKWTSCVPNRGDLVFIDLETKKYLRNLKFPLLTVKQVRKLNLWSLNSRSWYAYALNRAAYCVWLPRGRIEELNYNTQILIAKAQVNLGVPTLLKSSKLAKALKRKSLRIGHYHWLTSFVWRKLTQQEQVSALRLWFDQNGINKYHSIESRHLPKSVKDELIRIKFLLLNSYPDISGPNCFATVAGAITCNQQYKTSNQWLHWKPLAQLLKKSSYVKTRSTNPQKSDVLIFSQKRQVIHAGYYLADGLYLEKPGQDFYEPYRVGKYRTWKSDWPGAHITIWRRKL